MSFTSALDPQGPVAQEISDIMWMMNWIFGAVFVIVIALMFIAIFSKKKPNPRAPIGDKAFIILGGLFIPAIILSGLLIYTLVVSANIRLPKTDLTVEVTGYMWWWSVHYPELGITTANEIHVPVGKKVRVVLKSNDVIHSLWIPSLAGKTDLIPGFTNQHWFEASKPGIYRGQCAEYCGLQHANMAMHVIALEQSEFDEWVKRAAGATGVPESEIEQKGFQVFNEVGCAECHAVKGTSARADVGPDLTLLASRKHIASGIIENSYGNLGGWISHPQALKPGNKMPRTYLSSDQFDQLMSYLISLKPKEEPLNPLLRTNKGSAGE